MSFYPKIKPIVGGVTDKKILSGLVAIELETECCHECAYEKARDKFEELREFIDNTFGDRNLICVCPPIEAYAETAEV